MGVAVVRPYANGSAASTESRAAIAKASDVFTIRLVFELGQN